MRNLEPQDLTATPVDIETFLTSPDYLGQLRHTLKGAGL